MSPLTLLAMTSASWGPPPPVAPYANVRPPAQKSIVPMIFPVVGKSRFGNDYGAPRGGFRHTGIDIKAPKMTPIVAPFAGKIGLKPESFWIYGDNGWTVLGTHLNDDLPGRKDHRGSRDLMFAPDVVPGGRVRSGQLIGYVGESGMATGPHLHFEIYAPGAGKTQTRIRNPFYSLKRAQRIASPVPTLVAGKPPTGTMRLDGCLRYADPANGEFVLILTSTQLPTGRTVRVSRPRYVRLKASAEEIDAVQYLPNHVTIGVLVPAAPKIDGALASRLILP